MNKTAFSVVALAALLMGGYLAAPAGAVCVTDYHCIPGEAFQGNDIVYSQTYVSTNSVTAGNNLLYAPVMLPHGAVVTDFGVQYWNGHSTLNMHADFERRLRVGASGGAWTDITNFQLPPTGATYPTAYATALTDNTINNLYYFYRVVVSFTEDVTYQRVYGVIIVYNIDNQARTVIVPLNE